MSCSSAPGKIVKCVFQGFVDPTRIIRRKNSLTPGLQRLRRGAAALGCDLQRPTDMLACMANSDPQSVVKANLFVEGPDVFELLGQGWREFGLAAFEPATNLAG